MRILMMILFASLLFAQTPSGNAQNGRKLFENYGCYQCHGREAQGGLGTGPRLGPKPIAFVAVQRYIRHPTGQMPPYTAKVVSDKDLADIYAFLQSVKQPPAVNEIPLLNK
ncbi:MAG TPA: cytochrome c [Bryobacteraceae bacterium]|nr:cytochrome c [Bryobacteraceae bacterium]